MDKVVIGLIIANVLVSLKGFNDSYFFDKFKFQVNKVLSGEKIRLVSSGFLHADFLHLGFNMYALWLFGKIVNSNLGTLNFILIYFGSLILGNLYSLQVHKKTPYYSAIGASGAVSGIVFSAIILFPEMRLMIFPIPFYMPAYVFGIGYLLYSAYGMKNRIGNIGHSAHLGGAIAGYLLTILLEPQVLQSNRLVLGILFVIIMILLFGNKLLKK